MTELERARAHLRECQEDLRWARGDMVAPPNFQYLQRMEGYVLAALSLVWEEQQRTDGDYVFPRVSGNKDLGFEWA
jgi:hypothetical protein